VRELVDELARARAQGDGVALATVIATRRSAPRPIGSKLLVTRSGELYGSVSGGCVEADVYEACQGALAGDAARVLTYGISDDEAFEVGLPCGGEIDVLVSAPDSQLLARLEAWIARLGNPARVVEAFRQRDALQGQRIAWSSGQVRHEGEARGIDDDGALVVFTDAGERMRLDAGEVHLERPAAAQS